MRIRPLAVFLAVFSAHLVTGGRAVAAPGDFDPTFWRGQMFEVPTVGPVYTTAVRPDGLIILGGRKDSGSSSGTLAWQIRGNTYGWTSYDAVPGQSETATAIAALPDNRVVMAGAVLNSMYLLRLDAAMQPDPSFGQGGVARIFFRPSITVVDMAAQPDGKVLVLGAEATAPGWNLLLVRFLGDGSVDTSFAGGASQQITNVTPVRLVLQADGKILVAGTHAPVQGGIQSWFVCRFTASGVLDSAYGPAGTGSVSMGFEYGGNLWAAALAPDGGLLLAGSSFSSAGDQLALGKMDATGILDSGFGVYGLRRFNDGIAYPMDLAVSNQATPMLLLGEKGWIRAFTLTGQDFTGFGNQGVVSFWIPEDVWWYRMAVSNDGKLVVGGFGASFPDPYPHPSYTFALRLLLQ